ncbi:AraC family transcriptional regulator [Zobellella aerophila]|uniref:HTH araC/xylS-type domain-containing protein n=1 Tax=Zobellella aerophila TaxID=870480 RepID=A0ABP6V7C3_9GAMM
MIVTQARKNVIATRSGEHLHAYPQILIGVAGATRCEFDNSATRVVRGSVLMVPNSAKHSYAGQGEDSELLVLDLNLADELVRSLEAVCSLSFRDTLFRSPQSVELAGEIQPLLDFARYQLALGSSVISQLVNQQLVTLFLTLISQHYASSSRDKLPTSLRLDVLDRLIDNSLDEPPANQLLAEALHISESHLYYLCRKQFGLTPQQYASARRLNRARSCLQQTKMSVTQVALEHGFSDTAAFSRAYKRYFGHSPRQARSAG